MLVIQIMQTNMKFFLSSLLYLKNLTGLEEEFISGARLDTLVGTYTSIMGLVQSLGDEQAFSTDQNIRLVACFDNEEVSFLCLILS